MYNCAPGDEFIGPNLETILGIQSVVVKPQAKIKGHTLLRA